MNPPPPPPLPPMSSSNPHGMEANVNTESTMSHSFIGLMNVVNTLTQIFLGGVMVSAFCAANLLSENPSSLRGVAHEQHIYLCVFGYVLLMSQAILSLQPHVGWAATLKHPQKKNIHWIMQITGATLAIAGSTIKIADSNQPFQTAHGIMGCIALVLTLLSLISGLFHMVCFQLTDTVVYKTCHGMLGSLTITIAFITIILAFTSDMYRSYLRLGDKTANMAIFMTVGALVGILFASFTGIVKRILDK